MVDPFDLTKYNRTTHELEEMMLFAVAVAGKTAHIIAKAVDTFLEDKTISPFDYVRKLRDKNRLVSALHKAKMGKYTLLSTAYSQLVDSNIDLSKCSAEDLEQIHGVGPKTARMFLLHSRPNQDIAVIDTHILKYLSSLGHDVPKTTPSGKKYKQLESIFINHAKEMNRNIAELDLEIWKSYAKKNN